MAKSIPALVDPRLLSWARESARLSVFDLAAALDLPAERIVAWEGGTAHPSVAQLRKLNGFFREIMTFIITLVNPSSSLK